jgi:hypothetical protein
MTTTTTSNSEGIWGERTVIRRGDIGDLLPHGSVTAILGRGFGGRRNRDTELY